MTLIRAAAASRADLISRSLKRHRLVFVQMGSLFEPLRSPILDALGGVHTSVADRARWLDLADSVQLMVVPDLEECANLDANILGEVRELAFSLLDKDVRVCLISRTPRISYRSVPGSSVLEDAAVLALPVLSDLEIPSSETRDNPGWPLPAVAYGTPISVEMLKPAVSELGGGVIAALDHALFDIDPKSLDGLQFLGTREVEALRGSGLVVVDDDLRPSLTKTLSSKLLKEALAEHVSGIVEPSDELASVSGGLWHIERAIRFALRAAGITKYGASWRSSTVGGLKGEILRRAQLEGSVAAKSINDIRDPLEWLTLSELLEVVRGDKFGQLGVEPAVWRRLQEQLVPVRNRLAHVRMLKSDDHEVVRMWLSVVRDRLG